MVDLSTDTWNQLIQFFERMDSQFFTMEAANAGANIYAYFKNTETIIKHLHEIKKLQYE